MLLCLLRLKHTKYFFTIQCFSAVTTSTAPLGTTGHHTKCLVTTSLHSGEHSSLLLRLRCRACNSAHMPLLQWLNSGGNVTTLLILYSRTHILPLLNQCSTAALAQLLSLHSESIILPLLSRHYMPYMIQLLGLHYGIHIMPLLSKL